MAAAPIRSQAHADLEAPLSRVVLDTIAGGANAHDVTHEARAGFTRTCVTLVRADRALFDAVEACIRAAFPRVSIVALAWRTRDGAVVIDWRLDPPTAARVATEARAAVHRMRATRRARGGGGGFMHTLRAKVAALVPATIARFIVPGAAAAVAPPAPPPTRKRRAADDDDGGDATRHVQARTADDVAAESRFRPQLDACDILPSHRRQLLRLAFTMRDALVSTRECATGRDIVTEVASPDGDGVVAATRCTCVDLRCRDPDLLVPHGVLRALDAEAERAAASVDSRARVLLYPGCVAIRFTPFTCPAHARVIDASGHGQAPQPPSPPPPPGHLHPAFVSSSSPPPPPPPPRE